MKIINEIEYKMLQLSSQNMSSFNNSYSVKELFERKAQKQGQMINTRPILNHKSQIVSIDITYHPTEFFGKETKKRKKSVVNDQILDLDFGAVESEATDFEKDIMQVLNSHLKKEKWDQ